MLLKYARSFLAFLILGLVVSLMIFEDGAGDRASSAGNLFLHQNYIKELYRFPESIDATSIDSRNQYIDLRSEIAIFWYVFSQLPDEVTVYPSENYYYFSFLVDSSIPETDRYLYPFRESQKLDSRTSNIDSVPINIWGNIRLSPPDRNRGILHFAYWEFEDESSIDSGNQYIEKLSKYKQFSQKDGLRIQKLSDFRYAATYRGRTVIFNLYDLPQTPPKLAKLKDDEVFVQRTFDESGFRFFLVFQEDLDHFMYVLDEEPAQGFPESIDTSIASGNRKVDSRSFVIVDPRTGFTFYNDSRNNRKILIGIDAKNVMRNNYFDGPFDQLADNYVGSRGFPKSIDTSKPVGYYIERAYPYTRGKIDEYGKFLDIEGSRVAISPYRAYESPDELEVLVAACKERPRAVPSEFYRCITLDDKENAY